MSDWNNFFSSGIFSARARTYWIYKAIQAYDLANRATLMYTEVMDENGETKLTKGKGEEHHLTFTKEPGTESGTYLTYRVIPVKGATAECS